MARRKPTVADWARDFAHDVTLLATITRQPDRTAYSLWFILVRDLLDCYGIRKKPAPKDSIRLEELVRSGIGDKEVKRAAAPRPAKLLRYRTAANKLAAHLTKTRATWRTAGHAHRYRPDPEVTRYLIRMADAILDRMTDVARGAAVRELRRISGCRGAKRFVDVLAP